MVPSVSERAINLGLANKNYDINQPKVYSECRKQRYQKPSSIPTKHECMILDLSFSRVGSIGVTTWLFL